MFKYDYTGKGITINLTRTSTHIVSSACNLHCCNSGARCCWFTQTNTSGKIIIIVELHDFVIVISYPLVSEGEGSGREELLVYAGFLDTHCALRHVRTILLINNYYNMYI